MAENKKISEFLGRSELTGQEMIAFADGGTNGKMTTATLKEYAKQDLSGYATKDELNAKVSTETYNSDKATFATKTELVTKLDTSTYNSDKESFATKNELSAKVSGTGVTQMQVVTALPESPDANTLYIVTAAEEPA